VKNGDQNQPGRPGIKIFDSILLDIDCHVLCLLSIFLGEIQLGEDRGYFVAASDGNVFVYLGDGRQLFAFRFLSEK
jgi:hypothetical protein